MKKAGVELTARQVNQAIFATMAILLFGILIGVVAVAPLVGGVP